MLMVSLVVSIIAIHNFCLMFGSLGFALESNQIYDQVTNFSCCLVFVVKLYFLNLLYLEFLSQIRVYIRSSSTLSSKGI